jgi:outer membrane protein assembly factor BamB
MLHCLELATGKVLWKRDLRAEYAVPQNFFGSGPSPLVWNDVLIVNLGGKSKDGEELCVAAFNKLSGDMVWSVPGPWGASYASPIAATLRGKPRVLVFAGGESRPPSGGLLCIDPAEGSVDFRFPWRADKYESVNASTPIVVDSQRVFGMLQRRRRFVRNRRRHAAASRVDRPGIWNALVHACRRRRPSLRISGSQ